MTEDGNGQKKRDRRVDKATKKEKRRKENWVRGSEAINIFIVVKRAFFKT